MAKAKSASSKNSTKTKAGKSAASARLLPPPGGATVRMYRIGHGDCFLIAFAGDDPDEPSYVLIDCGYKPGSPGTIEPPTSPDEVVENIYTATGGRIDVAVITHEHQDHVNAISATRFANIAIGEVWFAWTENPADDLANDLRKKFKDKLVGLVAARNQLAAADGHDERVALLDDLLTFEFGGEQPGDFIAREAGTLLAAKGEASLSMNKKSMNVFKEKATQGIKFLRPHSKIFTIPGAKHVRVFPLGPPRDTDLLKSLDPTGDEEFHMAALAATSSGGHFAAAAWAADNSKKPEPPFADRYGVNWDEAFETSEHVAFFRGSYGSQRMPSAMPNAYEAPADADWRRIDKDWLYASSHIALDMNDQTNNSSLVLAFELGKGGKVLLFAADAQRGNWLSWARKDFNDNGTKVTARNLLARTVLYKVGHHGSHNATLNGQPTDEYTNLSWMAEGDYGHEFCAMITAVRKWAETQKGWDHPLKAIKDALIKKAGGRVFQTDTDFDMMAPSFGTETDWKAFESRTVGNRLYFDYTITT